MGGLARRGDGRTGGGAVGGPALERDGQQRRHRQQGNHEVDNPRIFASCPGPSPLVHDSPFQRVLIMLKNV